MEARELQIKLQQKKENKLVGYVLYVTVKDSQI